jgi:anti-anti-sigma factor
MFDIRRAEDGTVKLVGRFDAAQVEARRADFDAITSSCVLDLAELDYVSSAGLGVLFATLKRLTESGGALKLINLKPHIRELFQIAGFDRIFAIE